jgi:hypothetical protein
VGIPAPLRISKWTARVAAELKMHVPVSVRIVPQIRMPALLGWRRPTIVLPETSRDWSDEQLRVVLLHELGHVRHRDALWQLVSNLTMVAYFWHPLVWLAARKLVELRERACDDLVLAHGVTPSRYAALLVALVTGRDQPPAPQLIGMARQPGLEQRIRGLLRARPAHASASRGWAAVGIPLIAGAALLVAAISSAEPRPVNAGTSQTESADILSSTAATIPAATASPPFDQAPLESAADTPVVAASSGGVLRVRIVDAEGRANPKNSAQLWRRVADESQESQYTWRDPLDGQLWENVGGRSFGPETTFDKLDDGTYRVSVRGGHQQHTPFGISSAVTIDAAQRTAEVVVTLGAGANLRLRMRSAESGEMLEHCHVVLQRLDQDLPVTDFPIGEIDSRAYHFINGLPPGRYRIFAVRRAFAPDEMQYEQDEPAPEIEVNIGDVRELELDLIPVPLSDEIRAQRWPWVVEGTVRDQQGQPVAQAIVTASAGWGTLRRTGSARTDEAGNYRFRFGPGMLMSSSEPDQPPLNLQAALIHVRKLGYSDVNLSQQGDLLAAMRRPTENDLRDMYGRSPQQVFIPNEPRRVDFVLAPAARVVVEVIGPENRPLTNHGVSLKGAELPPGSNVWDSGRTDATGRCVLRDVPVGRRWHFQVTAPEGQRDLVTTSFTLRQAGTVFVRMRHVTDEATKLQRVDIDKFVDQDGNDLSQSALHRDPLTFAPLDAAGQQQARRILRQAVEANRLWLEGPVEEVQRVSYRLLSENGQAHSIDVVAGEGAWKMRGIVFTSALPLLAEQAENCVFQALEQTADRTFLAFRWLPVSDSPNTAPPRLILGESPAYNLRYSGPVMSGILELDPETLAIRRFEHGEVIESFDEYLRLPSGLQAPRRVRMDRGGAEQVWTFQVFSPGLWLLSSADIPGSPKLTNSEIRVNDAAAEPVR